MSHQTEARLAAKAAIKPVPSAACEIVSSLNSKALRRPAPAMAMAPSMNEKRAASSRLIPRKVPAKIVEPLRDMPGMIATACVIPISKTRHQENFLSFCPNFSGVRNIAPSTSITIPTEVALRKMASI